MEPCLILAHEKAWLSEVGVMSSMLLIDMCIHSVFHRKYMLYLWLCGGLTDNMMVHFRGSICNSVVLYWSEGSVYLSMSTHTPRLCAIYDKLFMQVSVRVMAQVVCKYGKYLCANAMV